MLIGSGCRITLSECLPCSRLVYAFKSRGPHPSDEKVTAGIGLHMH